ncbi:MAG: 30S ribosomal protein S17 [Acidobacteria bacterium]|nr:MAG: 30S ribosomal protein S17 [Acidobacteriota bacterium]
MLNKTRQQKIGVVSSSKMQKTIVVTVDRRIMHPLYKKVTRKSKRFLVHDERGECQPGDTVRIEETRPLSRLKRWRVVEVMSKAVQVGQLPEENA